MAVVVWRVALLFSAAALRLTTGIEDKEFWMNGGQEELRQAMGLRHNMGVAKNVILFLGDGMGVSTVTAARIYKGQKAGRTGEETQLNFEKFPHAAFSKTYCVDRQTTASASAAVAIMSGVKTNFGTVGFDANVKRGNCTLVNDPAVRVETMVDWSLRAGKSVGVVTTARVTHATPAASYAHSPDRNWERDSDTKDLPDRCVGDIATQLLKDNANITVILGGGRRGFKNRLDGKNLIDEWLAEKRAEGKAASYVQNIQELRDVDASDTDSLLGLFTESHMSFELSRDNNVEPSISDMTTTALEILRKNDRAGYFLLVEGARIDQAHHDNWAKRALAETVAMDEAVRVAKEMTGDDTLIVVTADHSHVFNIAGYPKRGNDILGLVDPVDPGQEPLDGKPYATLVYGDGPGPDRSVDLSTVDTTADDFRFQRVVPFQSEWETHGGEDVGIYATGPMAHLFHGVHEQNYIAHVMAYASCVGPNTRHCDTPRPEPRGDCSTGGAAVDRVGSWLKTGLLVLLALIMLL